MKLNLVIFDMDGTILDTLQDLQISLNVALTASRLPTRSLEEVRHFVGNGVPTLVKRGVPDRTPPEVYERVLADFNVHYAAHCHDHTRPYAGICPLIAALRQQGYRTAVVSNKDDYAVQLLCQRFFPGLFDVAVGSKPGVAKKPAPDSVLEALRMLSARGEEAVYVGDSDVDVATAKNADLPCIAVLWGFRTRAELEAAGATRFAAAPNEILQLL